MSGGQWWEKILSNFKVPHLEFPSNVTLSIAGACRIPLSPPSKGQRQLVRYRLYNALSPPRFQFTSREERPAEHHLVCFRTPTNYITTRLAGHRRELNVTTLQ